MGFRCPSEWAANHYNMTALGALKGARPRIVAVLLSLRDVRQATRLRRLPDFFELRLDALHSDLGEVELLIHKLRAPLIITARHPSEGGENRLSTSRRRELLERFLPSAKYLDLELRSAAAFQRTHARARKKRIKLIISVHDFRRPPAASRLEKWAGDASALAADVFKIVVRTESEKELEDLVSFYERMRVRLKISAMGVGKFGQTSRLYFSTHGSALNYVYLGRSPLEGQLSLSEMRQFLASSSSRRA